MRRQVGISFQDHERSAEHQSVVGRLDDENESVPFPLQCSCLRTIHGLAIL